MQPDSAPVRLGLRRLGRFKGAGIFFAPRAARNALLGRIDVNGHFFRAAHGTGMRLFATGVTFVFAIAGARWLGADVFGAYVALWAITGLITTAVTAGLTAQIGREIAASRGSGDRSALKPIVQWLIAGQLVLGSAIVAAGWWGGPTPALIATLIATCTLSGILASLYVGYERVLIAGWIGSVLNPLIALSTLWLLALHVPPSPLLPLAAQLTGAAAASLAFVLCWRGERLLNAFSALRAPWWSARHRPLLGAALTLSATQVLINLMTQTDILLLSALQDPEDVALYYAAARAALVVSFFFSAGTYVVAPKLTRLLAQKNSEEARRALREAAGIGFAVTLIVALCAVVLGPTYLGFFGADFGPAYPTLVLMCLGFVVFSAFGPAQVALRAARLDGALIRFTAFALVLNAAMSAALIPLLGIFGAAIGTTTQFVVYGALMARHARTKVGLRTDAFQCFTKPINAGGSRSNGIV